MSNITDKLKGSTSSLTIKFNAFLLAAFPVIEYAKEALPALQEFMTPDVYKVVGLIVVVANVLLRFKTTESLAQKGKDDYTVP